MKKSKKVNKNDKQNLQTLFKMCELNKDMNGLTMDYCEALEEEIQRQDKAIEGLFKLNKEMLEIIKDLNKSVQ